MIDNIRRLAALFWANKYYIHKDFSAQNFNSLLKNSNSFLLVMPDQEEDFRNALNFATLLTHEHKHISLFLRDNKVSLVQNQYKFYCIEYGLTDITKLKLPSRRIIELLNKKNFDAVIDLNIGENIYCSVITNLVVSKFRIGFRKRNSDRFYNLQIVNNEIKSSNSYINLLNSLQMF